MKLAVTNPNTNSVIDGDAIKVGIQELSGVENSSCIEVNLNDCMDYVPLSERIKLLEMAVGKLRYGGVLFLSGTDLEAICHSTKYSATGIEQINAALYSGRLSIDYLHNVLSILKEIDLEVEKASLENIYYSIRAKRPDAS